MAALQSWLLRLNDQQILQVALSPQADTPQPPTIECQLLLEEAIVVAIDTESWTYQTDLLTEIGLVSVERKRSVLLQGMVGDWAQNLMRQMRFDHIAIIEHAHLFVSSGKLGKNRFGTTRYFTLPDARTLLETVFNSKVENVDPRIAQCKRPVILIGHGLRHDTENFMKPGLNFSVAENGTVVRQVDTQQMARELEAWIDPITPSNSVGLYKLCRDVFGFEHLDPHTANNDAARTFMCAILFAYGWHRSEVQATAAAGMFMQDVANNVELHSRPFYSLEAGYRYCCTRCGSLEHQIKQCTVEVCCAACQKYDRVTTTGDAEQDAQRELGRAVTCSSHIEYYCIHVAENLAFKKRVMDAQRRGRPGTTTAWPDCHPASAYTGKRPTAPHEIAAYIPVARIHPHLPVSQCPPFEPRWAAPPSSTRSSCQSTGSSAPARDQSRSQVGESSAEGAHSAHSPVPSSNGRDNQRGRGSSQRPPSKRSQRSNQGHRQTQGRLEKDPAPGSDEFQVVDRSGHRGRNNQGSRSTGGRGGRSGRGGRGGYSGRGGRGGRPGRG